MKPTKPITLKEYNPRAKYKDVRELLQDCVNKESRMLEVVEEFTPIKYEPTPVKKESVGWWNFFNGIKSILP